MIEGSPAALRLKYAIPIERTTWILNVFKTTLRPVSPRALVVTLAVGKGEELPHLRAFVGTKARIHAFDILKPSGRLYDMVQLTRTNYHCQDIAKVNSIFEVINGPLNLVICRAPRVLESISPNKISYNEWWIPTLIEYAQKMSKDGQMLITTYTEEEQLKIVEGMRKQGLQPITGENTLFPLAMPKKYFGPSGDIRAGIDRFTIVVS